MGKSLTWNEAEPEVFEVPRIDDELIDDAFYQEDEIGEMRHTAFMIECGLEEDPPDGPDVPPIPWKPEDLKKAAEEAEAANKKEEEEKEKKEKPAPKRGPPKRTHSMDEGLVDLEEHLPEAAKKPEPNRGVVATHSGGVFQNRPARRKVPPSRTMSVDAYGSSGQKKTLSIGLARTEKKSIGGPRKIAASKSGSLHAMRKNLDKLAEGDEEPPPIGSPIGSPRRASKLVATKSGNLHGMRKALQKPEVQAVKEEEVSGDDEYTEPMKGDEPTKREPKRGSLVVTKSGTSHGLRRANRPERRDSRDSRSVDSTSTSGDSFLSDFGSSSSDDSDISIETDASEEDEPKPKPKTPKEILQQIKADKEKAKKREKRREEKKKAKKEKKKSEKDGDDSSEKKEKKKKPAKRFSAKRSSQADIPPAFRASFSR
ncbi:unnamed protein product [Cylindrotheca closterium]|uniref:Uncharacterized protein n=1 Tax=Cylindrotheca closterium TaxID=2856 RepID=A0AAD2FIN2_9STRA|nr:unnamed protein product [Cylindrotheca closterium]